MIQLSETGRVTPVVQDAEIRRLASYDAVCEWRLADLLEENRGCQAEVKRIEAGFTGELISEL